MKALKNLTSAVVKGGLVFGVGYGLFSLTVLVPGAILPWLPLTAGAILMAMGVVGAVKLACGDHDAV